MNTQQLWQSQALDAPRISLAFVRQQSDSLRRWAWMRNGINYVGAVAVLPFMVWKAWSIFSVAPLLSLAIALNVPLCVWLLFRWHKRAASREQPEDLGVLDALRFHRLQLERQRDVRLDRWRRWPARRGGSRDDAHPLYCDRSGGAHRAPPPEGNRRARFALTLW